MSGTTRRLQDQLTLLASRFALLDPSFATSIVPQHHYRPDTPRARIQASPLAPVLRRSVRRTIAVRSALNLRMRTTRVSPLDNPLIMSIEVENNSEHGAKFKMTQVDVEVTHAVVASIDTAELTKVPSLDLHNMDVSLSFLSFQ